eukprot:gene3904-13974_t
MLMGTAGMVLGLAQLQVIPIEDGTSQLHEAFNIRLEELTVVDMKFLEGCAKPTVAVLYEDPKHARHIKTYEISMFEKEFVDGPWSQQNLDPGSSLIIPVPKPLGGAIVVGESVVTYLGGPEQHVFSAPIKPSIITCYGGIDADGSRATARIDADGSRYLLSDHTGSLYLMVLAHDGNRAAGIKAAIWASRTGDSHLIRIHEKAVNPVEPSNYIEVLETYSNLGPIVDFCVVDLERQGQGDEGHLRWKGVGVAGQIVTCSGVAFDGGLRVVRNGIGINEQATVELGGIKYLVLSFIGETRILAINADDELDEAEITGFDGGAQTLYCSNTLHGQLVQVTSSSVRVMTLAEGEGGDGALQFEWKPKPGSAINMASGSATQVQELCALLVEGTWLYLEGYSRGIVLERSDLTLDSEISCLDVGPVEDGEAKSSRYVVVGTWSMEMLLFTLPLGKEPIAKEQLGGEVIPRSVLMNVFEGLPYCLAGMGDGQLLSWRMDGNTGALSDRKRIMLGTKPIQLKTFRFNGTVNAFAASDRPTIIYSSNKKLVFSNLNEDELQIAPTINYSSNKKLVFSNLNEDVVPLHEQPRRIAHQEATKSFGVLTVGKSAIDEEVSFLRVLDDQTFDIVASLPLEPMELCSSICSTQFPGLNCIEVQSPWSSDGAYADVRGDFVVVGDLMRSVSLLMYKQEEGTLELRARSTHVEMFAGRYQALPTTVCVQRQILPCDAVTDEGSAKQAEVAENSNNMYVVRKNSDAATDGERNKLEAAALKTLLFVTIEGVIGVIASLPKPLFEILAKLQDAMRKVVRGVGGFDHTSWRSFCNERKASESKGFVDGDLLEQFLDLGAERMQQVATLVGGGVSVEELTKHVEDIARLH